MPKLVPFPLLTPDDFRVKCEYMARRGWPERTLEAASSADMTKPAIVQLNENWKFADKNVAVISGPVGVGKTIAAARWCMGVTNRIGFVRAQTFAASSRYDRELRERYYNAEGLCLDDLGSEYADKKESFLVDLDELIDTYYSDRRPLLITTNITPDLFRKRYGERVWDRLHQCANWVKVQGESLRRSL